MTFTVTVTDEFNADYVFKTDDYKEVVRLVNDWLSTYDETPLYNINIDINP